jgi:hypothetical protein
VLRLEQLELLVQLQKEHRQLQPALPEQVLPVVLR